MAIQLRPVVEQDLPGLLAFWARTPGVGLNESDTPECLKIYLDRNPGLSVIALDGENIAGAVLCGHDGRRGYLYHLAVADKFRRQALGRQLVDRCLARLRAEGIQRCTIFLVAGNAHGEAFWRQTGWFERTDLKAFAKDL